MEGSTLCYKNGPLLPTLNFTTTCTTYGRYVIFYNERLDGVAYPPGYELSATITEICEVTVHGNVVKNPAHTNICSPNTCNFLSDFLLIM